MIMATSAGDELGLGAEQAALLEQWISEKLYSITNRDFRPYIAAIEAWQEDLASAEKWFTTKTTEYSNFTDTVIEQFTVENGEKRLKPLEIVQHDHTYCLRPDTAHKNRSVFVPHNCDFACWKKGVKPTYRHDYNPLEVPLHLGWQRVKMNRLSGGGTDIYYIAPCGRRLRSLDEIQLFLDAVCNGISITHFTFDPICSLKTNVVSDLFKFTKLFYYNPDISNGKERLPISCVNSHNSSGPDPFEYITERTHEPDVHIPTNAEFLVCCSCTDNCVNRSRCECWQLTIQESSVVGGEQKFSVGYVHQRLNRSQHSAIYECNPYCQCGSSCSNRVVQNGIQHRLQVFHTGKPGLGWGVRALDDIPKGSYICSYIGNIYTEQNAEMKAITLGDEYFADLDYIEVIEHHKENYEEEVANMEPETPPTLSGSEEVVDDSASSTWSFVSSSNEPTDLSMLDFDAELDIVDPDDLYPSSESDSSNMSPQPLSLSSVLSTPTKLSRANSLNCDTPTKAYEPSSTSNPSLPSPTVSLALLVPRTVSDQVQTTVPGPIPIPFATPTKDVDQSMSCGRQLSPRKAQGVRTRQYFGQNSSFIMDAKTKGNVGRYINHSCAPNLFVQNVFIDSHDIRFPWVAFFTKKRIKSMHELTWDYNYEVGSVENKHINCLCGAPQCKGRLL